MELIDKKGKINKTTFRSIVKEFSSSTPVLLKHGDNILATTTVENMIPDLFSVEVGNDKAVILGIEVGDKIYEFTGSDYNWFLKGDRLVTLAEYAYDLVSEAPAAAAPAKTDPSEEMHVAVCGLDENENPVIEDFKGPKSKCITWFNQQIVKNATIENEVNVLFCLDYSVEDPEWKSLKELFEEGKIDLC